MAKNKFDLATVIEVADPAVAAAALKGEKNPQYCHALLLKRVIEVGKATAQELAMWLDENLTLMADGGAQWKKYSHGCHMAYFVNRCRGAVKATKPDGTAVVQTATKVKKAKAEAEVPAEPAGEPAEEAEVSAEEAALEEAGA